MMIIIAAICLTPRINTFNQTLEITAIVMGVIMMLFAIVFFVLTLADKRRGVKFAFKVSFCVVALVCGAVTAIFRTGAVDILISLIALFLIVDGSFKLQTTVNSKRYRLALWWLILVPTVLTILGGFIAMRFFSTASEETSFILGFSAIIDAVANLLSAFYIARYESVMKSEIIDEYVAQTVKCAEDAVSE